MWAQGAEQSDGREYLRARGGWCGPQQPPDKRKCQQAEQGNGGEENHEGTLAGPEEDWPEPDRPEMIRPEKVLLETT